MSGLDTSLIQHRPNIYCVPGTVEEENGVGTWLQLSELQVPGPAARKQCCDGGSGTLHAAPVHSSTTGSAEGGKGLRSQAWGPAHSGGPHHAQAHKGLPRDLWSPWGCSDTLWIQGAALGSLSSHRSVHQPGQRGFTSWLSCQSCSCPSGTSPTPPSWLPWACGRSLQLTEGSPPPRAAPWQQLPAND